MEQIRRFVFRGNACAYGGQIYRRDDARLSKPVILVSGATSSLTVVGGLSSGSSKSAKFLDGFVRVGDAGTSAGAAFDDAKLAVAMSRGEVAEESLTATTKVGAWVENIVIGKDPKELRGVQPAESRKEPRLSIGWIGGSLTSSSGKPGDEPPIRLGRDTDVKEVFIDGYQLKIELNKAEFDALDTMSKLQTAAGDPAFIEKTGDCMLRRDRPAPTAAASAAGVVRPTPLLYGTIVRKLSWAKKPHPTATFGHHSVIVPDFGEVFFGEIFVTHDSRRITMLRVRFGSPVGGGFACSEFETNGSWYPPF